MVGRSGEQGESGGTVMRGEVRDTEDQITKGLSYLSRSMEFA